MKKTTMMSSLVLLVTAMMLSGCIYPYWDNGYDGRRGDGYRGYEHHDNGRRGR